MRSINRNFFYAAAITVCAFLSVTYLSCQKTGTALACDGVACQNGGYCLSGQCMCPSGYEDSACSSAVATKYIGRWSVLQYVLKSDSGKADGLRENYSVDLRNAATPTAFFIYNFLNNNEYNQVVCAINPDNSYTFTIDTETNAAMRFAPIHFWGAQGSIKLGHFPSGAFHPSLDTINTQFAYQYINSTGNWQTDTLVWVLYNHTSF